MKDELPANLRTWLDEAVADAARRGLPELEALLRSLARSTAALRSAAWNETVGARAPQVMAGRGAGPTTPEAGGAGANSQMAGSGAGPTTPDAGRTTPDAGRTTQGDEPEVGQ